VPQTSSSTVSTVEKAFLLLEFLAAARKPASLNDVTVAAGLPKPTAYRLLRSLQQMGYVSRPVGSRDYVIGPRAARLGATDPYTELKAAARPILRKLHGELNETVNLGVLSGTQVLYLDFVETTQPLRFIVTPGGNDPYYNTALGRAIASQLSDAQWEALLQATVLPRAKGGKSAKEALRATIAAARAAGFAEEREEAAQGVSCLALGLGFLGFPNAAVSVAVPVQRLTREARESIIAALKACTAL
jgi:IclR family acetate operon transcriptional repressor